MRYNHYGQTAIVEKQSESEAGDILMPDSIKGPVISGKVIDAADQSLVGRLVRFPEYVALDLGDNQYSVDLVDIKAVGDADNHI